MLDSAAFTEACRGCRAAFYLVHSMNPRNSDFEKADRRAAADIGGPDVLSYRRLMEIYAEEAGLPARIIIPVPVLTPRLSSYWVNLLTPVPFSLAGPLLEGLSVPVVCKENSIRSIIPQNLISCREAVQTCWSDAGPRTCKNSGMAGLQRRFLCRGGRFLSAATGW
jgi:hypothetical protein